MRPRWLAAAAVALALAACASQTPEQQAAVRLAKAEAEMNACKQRLGLDAIPTPDTVMLDDPATHGQPLTPETAGQLRLKVQCRPQLAALVAARKDVKR